MREAGTIKAKGKLIDSPPAPNEINFASEHVLQRWAERGMGPMDEGGQKLMEVVKKHGIPH